MNNDLRPIDYIVFFNTMLGLLNYNENVEQTKSEDEEKFFKEEVINKLDKIIDLLENRR